MEKKWDRTARIWSRLWRLKFWPKEMADAVLVVGAGISADGAMLPRQLANAKLAGDIFQLHMARNILVSGGGGPDGRHHEDRSGITEGSVLGDYMTRVRRFPPEKVRVDVTPSSSQDNLAFAKREAETEGWERIIVVCNLIHAVRMRFLVSQTDFPDGCVVEIVASYAPVKLSHILWEMPGFISTLLPRSWVVAVRRWM